MGAGLGQGCLKTAPQSVILRCVALVNAHISADMLRFPNRHALWLTARSLFFDTLSDLAIDHVFGLQQFNFRFRIAENILQDLFGMLTQKRGGGIDFAWGFRKPDGTAHNLILPTRG